MKNPIRALPLIERVLIGLFLFALLLTAAVCYAWHRHYVAIMATIATVTPRPDIAIAQPMSETQFFAYMAWRAHAEAAMAAAQGGPNGDNRMEGRWLHGDVDLPLDVQRATLAANAGILDDLAKLIAHGWKLGVTPDAPNGKPRFADIGQVPCLTWAARLLALRARLADDPTATLGAIDDLLAAMRPARMPSSLRDITEIADIRDGIHLTTALLGTLPADARKRFVDQPDQGFRDLLAMWELDRVHQWPALIAADAGMSPWEYVQVYAPFGIASTWRYWQDEPGYYVQRLQDMATQEDFVATRNRPAAAAAAAALPTCVQVEFQNGADATIQLRRAYRHRMTVLALQVLAIRDRDGEFPADGHELDLAPGNDHLALVYCRRDDRRFTISVDLAAPMPAYAAAGWNGAPPCTTAYLDGFPYTIADASFVIVMWPGYWSLGVPGRVLQPAMPWIDHRKDPPAQPGK